MNSVWEIKQNGQNVSPTVAQAKRQLLAVEELEVAECSPRESLVHLVDAVVGAKHPQEVVDIDDDGVLGVPGARAGK